MCPPGLLEQQYATGYVRINDQFQGLPFELVRERPYPQQHMA